MTSQHHHYHNVQLEPCFQEALEHQQLPPDFVLTPEALREIFSSASSNPKWIQRLPPVIEQTWTIPNSTGNGPPIQLRMTRPPGTQKVTLPVIIYLHGGGWVIGDEVTHLRPRTELAVAAHAAVIFVHYSLAPEHKYPVALEECYDTVIWTANEANARSIHVDPSKLVVAGDSAGATLATAITILAKQRQFTGIRGQILFYPATDTNFDTDSYNRFGEGYDLTREMMQWFWNHYVPDDVASRREIPTVAPLKASLEELRGLTPALVITCEADVLVDEGEAYARKLLAAGVDVTATRILGTLHGFFDMPFFECRAAITALDLAVTTLHRIWNTKKSH
ncbi:alpha/beta hydrolase fold-domain-containing protein [Zychaea mexicana]|uniref:alpha/beta hydrolase fold-domain-containing protein n=1 Tax=Zychaea mexicana TaxID=64656 RepID=UPI0022FEF825|nr:alpha/beta hydrolase fold-domain-containing protein [Zychaea mexicana]KAI9495439.1 alpha/beta hydrolase fold-domain-containing protein [Zychaea mexicana]